MRDYDDAVAFLGEWGPFQRMIFFLLSLSTIPNGFTGVAIVFVGDTPDHKCVIPVGVNISGEWRNVSIPWENVDGERKYSQCRRYKLDEIKRLSDRQLIPGVDVNITDLEQEKCVDGWEYRRDTYKSTIVTEWDMVCDDSWKGPLTSSAYFGGVLFGSFLSGQLSDRFGRKKAFFSTMAIQTLFNFIEVFSPSWELFCVFHFFNGSEILSKSIRIIYSTLGVCICYAIGYMMLPLAAFFIRDWRILLLILSIPGLFYIPLWWFIPESPRWLLSQGRVQEAEAILRKAARMNKVTPPDIIFEPVQPKDNKSEETHVHTILDLLRSGNICCITILSCLVWMILSIGYFALSLNTSSLHGNIYLNCFSSGAVEVPAYIATWLLLQNCSRRLSLFFMLVQGGTVLLFIQLIPQDLTALCVAMEMLGKFGFTSAFAIVYAFTAELFPTVVRNMAVGVCSMASRIGSISAPYFVFLGKFDKFLPYILMGSLTIIAGVLALLLPESFGVPLPETIDQMQHIKGFKKRKTLYNHNHTAGGDFDSPDVLMSARL
ncbi:solute carrier family 22 member 4 isoform X2 [Amia ocellicauda]|uniref:solute carrier family 22 member 4 isoform X2 n=1 Tax=Amia ocellicauda TaxID=2972642 RepID=UPI003464D47F